MGMKNHDRVVILLRCAEEGRAAAGKEGKAGYNAHLNVNAQEFTPSFVQAPQAAFSVHADAASGSHMMWSELGITNESDAPVQDYQQWAVYNQQVCDAAVSYIPCRML
jgi:hypothetical protein